MLTVRIILYVATFVCEVITAVVALSSGFPVASAEEVSFSVKGLADIMTQRFKSLELELTGRPDLAEEIDLTGLDVSGVLPDGAARLTSV